MKSGILILAVLVLTIAGCFRPVPKCDDEVAIDLVKQIAGRELTKQIGARSSQNFSFTVGGIRPMGTDQKTGAQTCGAQLGVRASNTKRSESLSIVYTVESTDEGVRVSVHGLY